MEPGVWFIGARLISGNGAENYLKITVMIPGLICSYKDSNSIKNNFK